MDRRPVAAAEHHFGLCADPMTDESGSSKLADEAQRHRALGTLTRLRILELLGDGPRSVTEVAATVGVALSTASRSLAMLEQTGLIRRERRGMSVVCRA